MIYMIKASALSQIQKEKIWTIYKSNYSVCKKQFYDSIPENSTIILYAIKRKANIVGFAIADVQTLQIDGKNKRIIYTTRLVIEPKYRGNKFVEMSGFLFFIKEKIKNPSSDYYWLFTAISYPGYLMMARNFKEFWPAPNWQTPPEISKIKNEASKYFYKDYYDQETGTANLPLGLDFDPFAHSGSNDDSEFLRFFKEMVPYANQGQALVCLVPVDLSSFIALTFRALLSLGRKVSIRNLDRKAS